MAYWSLVEAKPPLILFRTLSRPHAVYEDPKACTPTPPLPPSLLKPPCCRQLGDTVAEVAYSACLLTGRVEHWSLANRTADVAQSLKFVASPAVLQVFSSHQQCGLGIGFLLI